MFDAKSIREAIKNTNLQFLWDLKGEEFTLSRDINALTHGSVCKGNFISCLVGSCDLPAGTRGLVFRFPNYEYSETKWNDAYEAQMPKKGAKRYIHSTNWMFCTLVTLETGDVVLAAKMEHVKHTPPIFDGIV